MKVGIINIGCFKNLVDSEWLMAKIEAIGPDVEFGRKDAESDILIVNTCGFTGDAEHDTLELLHSQAARKRNNEIGKLWVMGCYGQKRGEALRSDIPEIDAVFGNFHWADIIKRLGGEYTNSFQRKITTPRHYAYVKISEGCNQPCSYCIKPILNGPMQSRPIEEIVAECRYLQQTGIREIQIVAQNTTAYGLDIYHRHAIAELVKRISDIEGIDWIRIHYGYPLGFPTDLLDVMAERDNVCKYLDMALQHCSTKMLRLMRRGMSREQTEDLIKEIRSRVPGIYLRTTMMTGHPGETEADFEELVEFVKAQRFERMGVFPYSHQPGSYSDKHYIDDVPEDIKRHRALRLMDIQKQIYLERNNTLIGQDEQVIIDSILQDGTYLARRQYSTPMADPKVLLHSSLPLQTGSFYSVRFTGVQGRDLKAELL